MIPSQPSSPNRGGVFHDYNFQSSLYAQIRTPPDILLDNVHISPCHHLIDVLKPSLGPSSPPTDRASTSMLRVHVGFVHPLDLASPTGTETNKHFLSSSIHSQHPTRTTQTVNLSKIPVLSRREMSLWSPSLKSTQAPPSSPLPPIARISVLARV